MDPEDLDNMTPADLGDAAGDAPLDNTPEVRVKSEPAPEPVEDSGPDPIGDEPGEPVAAPQGELSEVDQLRAQLEHQNQIMRNLLQGKPIVEPPKPKEQPPAQPTFPAPEQYMQQLAQYQAALQAQQAQQQQPAQPKTPEYVKDEEFDSVMSDPAKFNEFLHNVIGYTRHVAVQEALGVAMQQLPQAILPSVYEAASRQFEVRKWASENPVVMQNPEYSRAVLNQIDGFYPDASVEEKLNMALEYIKRTAGPVAQQAAPQPKVASTPAFASPPRGGVPRPKQMSDIQRELDELTL